MNKENFEKFKETYLKRFRKYYRDCTNNTQRKRLKQTVLDNISLNEKQKKQFWEEVVSNER